MTARRPGGMPDVARLRLGRAGGMGYVACLGVERGGGMPDVPRLRVGRAEGMVDVPCLGLGRGGGMEYGARLRARWAGGMEKAARLGVGRGGGMVEAGRLGVILSIGRESYLCEAITMRMICLRYSRFSGCDSSSSPMIISLSMYM